LLIRAQEGIGFGIRKKRTTVSQRRMVFFFDVDNTLLDNDRVTRDIRAYLIREVGRFRATRYWKIFEDLRNHLGYADYLGALQNYRKEYPHDTHLLRLSRFLIEYDFRRRLFPGALKVLKHVRRWGNVALLTDGDVVFQPRKVQCSGLLKAVDGQVLIYVHKEQELKDVEKRLPAGHYVMVDDKIRILTAIKRKWRSRVTTVFVRQGHYASDKKLVAKYPAADVAIDRIADLMKCDVAQWRPR
jgi:FMN phosphatase YigB (HAD superfamily)